MAKPRTSRWSSRSVLKRETSLKSEHPSVQRAIQSGDDQLLYYESLREVQVDAMSEDQIKSNQDARYKAVQEKLGNSLLMKLHRLRFLPEGIEWIDLLESIEREIDSEKSDSFMRGKIAEAKICNDTQRHLDRRRHG